MKQKIILLLAILAGFAAFLLSKKNIENFKDQFTQQFATVQVIGAARDIPPGTVIRMDDIGNVKVFAKAVTGRAVRPDELTDLVGKKTHNFIQKLQPVLWSDIDLPYGGLGGLAAMVLNTERAISIPVDQTASVTGHVRPNDHVDILGTFSLPPEGATAGPGAQDTVTLTILQDVIVLATGKNLGRRGPDSDMMERYGGEQYSTVTVLVTPKEAEMLVFAHQKGKLTLALRNREDVSVQGRLESVDFKTLEKNFNELNQLRQQRQHTGVRP